MGQIPYDVVTALAIASLLEIILVALVLVALAEDGRVFNIPNLEIVASLLSNFGISVNPAIANRVMALSSIGIVVCYLSPL